MNTSHTPQAITGYRSLTTEEVELINLIKAVGNEQIADLIYTLRGTVGIEQRWVSIAQTHFQQGLMALARAVAKPAGF